MKKNITVALFLAGLLLIFFSACGKGEGPTTPTTLNAHFEFISYTKEVNEYGWCQIEGLIKNTGNMPGYNVMLLFSAYNSSNTIIDTSSSDYADLGTISANHTITFGTAFFGELKSWTEVAKLTYKITWLDDKGSTYNQEGVLF